MNYIIKLYFIIFINFIYCFKNKIFSSISNKKQNDFEIINILPRKNDNNIYTQGIFFSKNNKYLYESGGLYNKSSLIKLNYPSLTINKKVNLKGNLFGEGIAECENYIYQLTWKEKKILKYDENLNLIKYISLDDKIKEGWGLANYNKDTLLLTDGSNNIYYLDCNKDLKIKKILSIYDNNNNKVNDLNDLIYNKGYIYANIYYKNNIVKINEKKGKIEKIYDLDILMNNEINNYNVTKEYLYKKGYVLNGIAYNKKNKSFLVTGKKWNNFYEIIFK